MALSAVLSLVTIISIYREGGILKRLSATPLRPHTILSRARDREAAVHSPDAAGDDGRGSPLLSRRAWTGRRSSSRRPSLQHAVHRLDGVSDREHRAHRSFRTADRALLMYPMLGLSGLFVPIASLPPAIRGIARFLPLTYAVSLLRGIWRGDGWIRARRRCCRACDRVARVHRARVEGLPVGIAQS